MRAGWRGTALARAQRAHATHYPWSTSLVRSGRPTIGNLMGLCEENYGALMRLIPDLRGIQGESRSALDQDLDLHLEILEQSPYTTLLRLTCNKHIVGRWL